MEETEYLKQLETRIKTCEANGIKLPKEMTQFIDDLYVLTCKLYMMIHKSEEN
tara:strand:- start:1467 stop:1625 length:159 start_codon:yes stop_codon:yes gene_type:complete